MESGLHCRNSNTTYESETNTELGLDLVVRTKETGAVLVNCSPNEKAFYT